MKINQSIFYSNLFILIILLQIYLYSFKINFFIQLIVLFFIFYKKISLSINLIKIIFPILLIILIGFIGTIINKYNLYNIIKDIIHFLKPIIAILISYIIFSRINNFKLFIKTIVITAYISAIIHLFIVFFINKNFESVHDIREFTRDNLLELFAIFLFSFYKKFNSDNLFQNSTKSKLIYYTILISCILYFSRTMIIIALILFLTIRGYTILTNKSIKIILGIITLIIGFYIFLFSVNIQRNQDGIESFLYKIKIAPEEIFETRIDRENHADIWDHWRGYEAKRTIALLNKNPLGYITGLGYGSLVNLKFYAPVSSDKKGMKYISELHNGYMYVLYKTGIIGLFLYLYWLYILYKKIYINFNYNNIFISGLAISLVFSSLVIGSLFNCDPIYMFLLGGLFVSIKKQY